MKRRITHVCGHRVTLNVPATFKNLIAGEAKKNCGPCDVAVRQYLRPAPNSVIIAHYGREAKEYGKMSE